MYKLIDKEGKEYSSECKGHFGGHRGLKIYGKLDCPSALRYLAAGRYSRYRVFFADEESALAAGYRPCGVCMKEHYKLWKDGRLMNHALSASPVLSETVICSVHLANGETKELLTEQFKNTSVPNYINDGVEYVGIKIEDDYCIVALNGANGQWGYTIIWDYVKNKLVHLTNTPYVVSSTIFQGKSIGFYLVQHWGHPADLWYSISPLEVCNANYEPEKISLELPLDESVRTAEDCSVSIEGGILCFRAGGRMVSFKDLPNN